MFLNLFSKRTSGQNRAGREMGLRYRIGDRVQSSRQGKGTVRALRPDGSVIVRFDGEKNSQPVYPTLLN